jgi:hypothetical protein
MKTLLLASILLFLPMQSALAVTENTGRLDNITTNNPAKITVDVLKNLNINTTGGLYLPNGTTAQRISPSKDGFLRYNSTTGTAELYANSAWGAVGGGLSAWVTAKAYSVGDIVIQSNLIYKCLIAHTSGTFATDLGASDWVEVSAPGNLTGDMVSTGLSTSYSAIVPTTKGGTGLSTVGTETKVLKVVSGVPAYGEEDRSNLLVNPNFEDTALTGWACTTGTCTSTTTSGEFTEGLAAYKITSGAPTAINASQSVSTLSGSTTQYVVGVNYKVDSTMTDFQICTLIAGAEKTCVPSANLIIDNAYHSIEIPEVITPGSTVGIKVKTTATYNGKIAYLDKAYIKQGLGTQNLALDYDYTAQVSVTGVISALNKPGWLTGNCVVSLTAQYDCPIASGLITTQMNCQVTAQGSIFDDRSAYYDYTNSTSTNVRYRTANTANATATAYAMSLKCSKTGNDYLASSAAVYSQASAESPVILTSASSMTVGLSTDTLVPLATISSNTNNYSLVSNGVTIRKSGKYLVRLSGNFSANTDVVTMKLDVNGAKTSGVAHALDANTAGSWSYFEDNLIIDLSANDVLKFYASQTVATRTASDLKMYIQDISPYRSIVGSFAGYSPITSQVGARAYASAAVISGTLATVVWTTESYDANSALASGVFTCPVAGKYQVNTRVEVAGTIALNTQLDLQAQKNGTVFAEDLKYAGGVMTDQTAQLSDVIDCVVGDTVRVQVSSGATTPSIVSSNSKNFFSIQWVAP